MRLTHTPSLSCAASARSSGRAQTQPVSARVGEVRRPLVRRLLDSFNRQVEFGDERLSRLGVPRLVPLSCGTGLRDCLGMNPYLLGRHYRPRSSGGPQPKALVRPPRNPALESAWRSPLPRQPPGPRRRPCPDFPAGRPRAPLVPRATTSMPPPTASRDLASQRRFYSPVVRPAAAI